MARMIPPYYSNDIKSGAEQRIFEDFKNDPDTEDWVCLHSLGLSKHVNQIYGEIDFVILAPGEGIFCLEVKGGRISSQNGIWSFTNRYGEVSTKNKGPFMQARDGMFSLQNAVRNHFGYHHACSGFVFGFGVVFPDISYMHKDSDGEEWQVFDRGFRRPIGDYIRQLSRNTHDTLRHESWYHAERTRPTVADIAELIEFMRGDFETTLCASDTLEHTTEKFLRLTQEQYLCLDALQFNDRCLFDGGAGTGKTLLAMEYARRESGKGQRVLFLCFNRLLGRWISKNIADSSSTIKVESFYKYLESLIATSSLKDSFDDLREANTNVHQKQNQQFYDEDYPLYALDAITEGNFEPFDCLIVDEGQDLICPAYLDVLEVLLKGGLAGGRWAIFCDFHRQAIYTEATGQEMVDLINKVAPHHTLYRLKINCRNTSPISEETALISGFDSPPCLSSNIDGAAVDYQFYSDMNEEKAQLINIIESLLADGYEPKQITILARVIRKNSCLANLPSHPNFKIVDLSDETLDARPKNTIAFATIQSFKGLESPIVIVVDIEHIENNAAALLYVAMSRATVRLFMLIKKSARREYDAAVKKNVQQILMLQPVKKLLKGLKS